MDALRSLLVRSIWPALLFGSTWVTCELWARGMTAFKAFVLADGIVSWRGESPKLVAGMFVPGFRNLYVFGMGKLRPVRRYGVGPPISAGAELLAVCIRAKRELSWDLGEMFRHAGGTPDREILLDPAVAMRLIALCTRLVPRVPRLQRFARRYGTPAIPVVASVVANHSLEESL